MGKSSSNLSVAMFDYRRARPNTDKYIRLSENRYPKSTVSSALSVWRYTLHFRQTQVSSCWLIFRLLVSPHEFKLNRHFQTHPYWYIVVIWYIPLIFHQGWCYTSFWRWNPEQQFDVPNQWHIQSKGMDIQGLYPDLLRLSPLKLQL